MNSARTVEQELSHAYQLRLSNLPRSIELTQEVLRQCETTGDEEGLAKAKNQLALFYLIQGKFNDALTLSEQTLLYFQKKNDLKGIALAKYNIGSVYYRTNKYHQALIILVECLDIYRQLNDYHNQARTLKSMGTIYEYFTDDEKAAQAYELSIAASRQIGDLSLESNALNPLSGLYYNQGKKELALQIIEQSIQYKEQTNDVRGLGFALYGRGKIFLGENQVERALKDFLNSVDIMNSEGDLLGMCMVNRKLGATYALLGQMDKAYQCLHHAIKLAEQHEEKFIRFKVYYQLYQLARAEKNETAALEYLEKYILHKESVINNETYSVIKSYEALSKIEALERESKSQLEKTEIIKRKNEELDSFFYRVSHDLKGPISSLLGLNNVVQMEIKDPAALQMFQLYHSQVLRLNDIVMGLINLTEIKNTEQLKSKVDFKKLVEDCIGSCQYLPAYSKMIIEKEIAEFEFYSEWAIINTILQNLIENAIKYYREQPTPTVKINIHKTGNQVVIIVEDNGQGIDPAHQQHIFNIFYRANALQMGSGLGLYILRRAVERLNGRVNVVSTLGSGSVFTVTLPS